MDNEHSHIEPVVTRYRAGWSNLHPMPLVTRPLDPMSPELAAFEVLRPRIAAILDDCGMKYRGFSLKKGKVYRMLGAPIDLLSVDAQDTTTNNDRWSRAIARIVAFTTYRYVVEIMNWGYAQNSPWPVLHHESDILEAWDAVAPKIIHELDVARWQWTALSLVLMGPEHAVTVLIEIIGAADTLAFRLGLRSCLQGPIEDIDIWESQCLRPPPRLDGSKLPTRLGFGQDRLRIGDSLSGCTLDREVGTLGGFLTMRDPRRGLARVNYALTSFHTVSHELHADVLKPLDCPNPPEHLIYQEPAPCDIKDMERARLAEIHDMYIYQHVVKDEWGQSVAQKAESGDEKANSMLFKGELSIRRAEDSHRNLSGRNCRVGNLRAASGYKFVEEGSSKVALDWALVTVERDFDTFLPTDIEQPKHIRHHPQVRSFSLKPVASWKPVQPENKPYAERVIKVGRASGWTEGLINAARSFVKHDEKWPPSGPSVEAVRIENPHKLHRELFVEPGDSGSWVLDKSSGSWIGLLLGGHPVYG
ncbi:uncharacterized protein K452DRAFT_288497 [Aplosporella prunicola CBS 121167]|uniref:Uncharacterized protein n=1 Tax=Aplosporella prunicola CBS 121167 TaxID=1176127 RepID=A0A6A6BCW5_9PEZI|nr:uncharacterized protein K452DRAFT_288497 [Aplosporella prunicola CBS 121167]KAF2141125.1 hypothetical protein K452DRAFT_288497 [Aplosporella prunicola CBS 121167]